MISAAKNAEGAKVLEYQYQYDDIGNRITSPDLGTNRTYTANNLNQYASISNSAISASPREAFTPQFYELAHLKSGSDFKRVSTIITNCATCDCCLEGLTSRCSFGRVCIVNQIKVD